MKENPRKVGELALAIRNADALPSKKEGVDRPSARSEQCQSGTDGSKQDKCPGINRLREEVPQRDYGDDYSYERRP